MNNFIELTETIQDQSTRKVWINPNDVCLVTESTDGYTTPNVKTVVFLRNGEYVHCEDYPHTVMNKLGITT